MPDRPTLSLVEFLTQMWDEQEEQANRRFDEWRAHGGVLDLALTLGPAYVLADIAAKRAILARHEEVPVAPGRRETTCAEDGAISGFPCPTVRLLAAPFSSHPDYRSEWEV